MPVEIKELHIRVTVSGKPAGEGRAAQAGPAGQGAGDGHDAGREELVAECVEQVFQLLQARKER
jgi:hypothetical protein